MSKEAARFNVITLLLISVMLAALLVMMIAIPKHDTKEVHIIYMVTATPLPHYEALLH